MKWNWQQPDWPRFSWSAGRLAQAEQHFLVHGGIIHGAVGHLDSEERDLLIVEAMSDEAVTSSEIEGEILNRDSESHWLNDVALRGGCRRRGRGGRDAEQVQEDVRAAIAHQSDCIVHTVYVVPPMWLIKTSSGKISRTRCKAKFLEETEQA